MNKTMELNEELVTTVMDQGVLRKDLLSELAIPSSTLSRYYKLIGTYLKGTIVNHRPGARVYDHETANLLRNMTMLFKRGWDQKSVIDAMKTLAANKGE